MTVQRRFRQLVTVYRILVITHATSPLLALDPKSKQNLLTMKKLVSLVAIVAIILTANCSRIEQNNDPIIGIWSQSKITTEENSSKTTVRKEWIFNDVYLGRYHEITGDEITLQTDFKWSRDDGKYIVEYRGLEDKPNNVLTIEKNSDDVLLKKADGNILALRE